MDEETLVTEVTDEEANGPQSLMEQLRAKRQEVAETHDTFLPLPQFAESDIMCKYRLMERKETEAIAKSVKKRVKNNASEFQMQVLASLLVNACEGFYIANGTPDPDPLVTEGSGEHVTSYDMFARELGWSPGENSGAIDALYYVFGGNEFAVGQQGIMLNRWFTNTGVEVDTDLLGDPQ